MFEIYVISRGCHGMKNLEIWQRILVGRAISKIPPQPSLAKGRLGKIQNMPPTLPSPARGEAKHMLR